MFVNSLAEYCFWSEKFKNEDLRNMDITIRAAMNRNGAKHTNQTNEILYLKIGMEWEEED